MVGGGACRGRARIAGFVQAVADRAGPVAARQGEDVQQLDTGSVAERVETFAEDPLEILEVHGLRG